jgi:hypothetical protein
MPLESSSIPNASAVLIVERCSDPELSILKTDFLTAKLTGTICLPRNASDVISQSKPEIVGWKLSIITIIANALNVLNAIKIWKARVSSLKEENHFAKLTLREASKKPPNHPRHLRIELQDNWIFCYIYIDFIYRKTIRF